MLKMIHKILKRQQRDRNQSCLKESLVGNSSKNLLEPKKQKFQSIYNFKQKIDLMKRPKIFVVCVTAPSIFRIIMVLEGKKQKH